MNFLKYSCSCFQNSDFYLKAGIFIINMLLVVYLEMTDFSQTPVKCELVLSECKYSACHSFQKSVESAHNCASIVFLTPLFYKPEGCAEFCLAANTTVSLLFGFSRMNSFFTAPGIFLSETGIV